MKLIALVLILAGCASKPTANETPSEPAPKQATIRFAGKAGAQTDTVYRSNSRTRRFQDGQITNDRTEIVDFTTRAVVRAADADKVTTGVKTIAKDGSVDLHDLAFPELNEEIEYVTKSTGQIVKAGRYPPHSIFFVPPMPVPEKPVAVGDTWPLEHTWFSGAEHIPLKLSVVGILKGIVACEGAWCADVEVSGGVAIAVAPSEASARFESRVWGRMLFSLAGGDILWSELRSREEVLFGTERTLVESCMVSEVKSERHGIKSQLDCDPKEQPVARVPRL